MNGKVTPIRKLISGRPSSKKGKTFEQEEERVHRAVEESAAKQYRDMTYKAHDLLKECLSHLKKNNGPKWLMKKIEDELNGEKY